MVMYGRTRKETIHKFLDKKGLEHLIGILETLVFDADTLRAPGDCAWPALFVRKEGKLLANSDSWQKQLCNEITLCLETLAECLKNTKSQYEELMLLVPKPSVREVLFEDRMTNLLFFCLNLGEPDSDDTHLTQSVLDLIIESYCDRFNYKQLSDKQLFLALLLRKLLRLVGQFREADPCSEQKRLIHKSCLSISRILKIILENLVKDLPTELQKIFGDVFELKITANVNNLNLHSASKVGLDSQSYFGETNSLQETYKKFGLLRFLHSYFWHVLIRFGENRFVELLQADHVSNVFVEFDQSTRVSVLGSLNRVLAAAFDKFRCFESSCKRRSSPSG